jgi:hypothetical protein
MLRDKIEKKPKIKKTIINKMSTIFDIKQNKINCKGMKLNKK